MFFKRNTKATSKVMSLVLVLSMLVSVLSVVPVMAYSAGDSFTIYSNPANSKNTAGSSYIWAFAPDAKVEGANGDGAKARFFHAGDGIIHEPAAGSLDGLNTRIIVTHRAANTWLDGDLKCSGSSDLAAVVTYMENGEVKKSPAFRFTGYHYNNKQWKDCGDHNTVSTFDIGTYPNVVNVNVYHLLSDPLDGSTLIWGNSEPYHENVRFEITGAAGEAVIPVDDYYIETDVLPNADSGLPKATPAPTAQIPVSAGVTPEPFVEPGEIQNGPVVAFGLGTTFTLFPGDLTSASLTATNNIIENAAPNLNSDNGVTRYELASGATVSHNIPWGINNTTLNGSADSKVIFKPLEGRLEGVVTKVRAYYHVNGGAGLDAIVTYDGGKTKTVNFVPDNFSSDERTEMIDLGLYPNLEYVTVVKRGTNGQRIPSLTFTVVNEDTSSLDSLIPEKVYEKPNIPTVTPKPEAVIPVPTVNSSLSINEAVSGNELGYVDQFGAHSDWIEIYNSSNTAVDISGYGLTDNVNKAFKWALPSNSIVPANGYLLVIASGNNTVINGEIHADFSISKGGETLMLSDTAGEIVSVMDMPALEEDFAIARVNDGSSNLRVVTPTPGESNNNATVESVVVSRPEFSAQSGFYDEAFELTISAQGGKVYYTTDGSEPGIDDAQFTSPVSIYNRTNEPNYFSAITYKSSTFVPSVKVDKCMVVRAVTIDDEGNKSDVVTKTYFVGLDIMEDYNNTMVMSISASEEDFFDSETGMFPNYEEQHKEYEKRVHMDLFEKDGSLAISQDCGARVRGYGYKSTPQKGINFHSRSEYGASKFEYPLFEDNVSMLDNSLIETYDTFAIRQGSLLWNGQIYNDGLAQYIGGKVGNAYQSQRPVIMFLNGEYWGVYYMSERVEDDYIETHYGIPKEDVIVIKNHVNKGEAVEEDRILYQNERSWLSNTDFTKPENYAMLEAKYDISNLMFYYATNINEKNLDWIGYNFATWRSRYITDRPYEDGKWRFLTYDMDTAFNSDFGVSGAMGQSWGKALMSNPSLKKVFANILLDTYNNAFSPMNTYEEMRYWYDEYYEVFDPKVRQRWGDSFWLEDRILQSFGSLTSDEFSHVAKLKSALGLTGKYVPVNVRVNNPSMGNVRVNSIDHDFSKGSFSTRNFTDYTTTLLAQPKEGYKLLGWETSEGTTLTSYTDALTYATLSNNGSVITAIFGFENDEVVEISSADDLFKMASDINSQNAEYSYRKYVLTADIDMSGVAFTSIGTSTAPFNGEFDGNGFTISGITVDTTIQGSGLFGYVGNSGVVKNVGVKDISIIATGNNGKNVGGIVGNNKGLVENCYSTGSLSGISTVGGIVGNNNGGTVKNCYSIADVSSDSANTLGGVAGKTEAGGKVINSYSLIEPVAKNDGGTVDTLTSVVNENDVASGYLAYILNSNGKNAIWGQNDAPVIANDTYKAITVKVIFLEDYVDERYGYTYVGGPVALPDETVEWELEDGTPFTKESTVTEDTYVIRKGSSVTPPTPTPIPTATPIPTPVPTPGPTAGPSQPTPAPTATPTPKPTFNPETGIEIWANKGNDFYNEAFGYAELDNGMHAGGKDENGLTVGTMWYFNDGPDARAAITGNDASVTFYPTKEMIAGVECDIVLTIFGEYGYSELDATITYDGGKTETIDILYQSTKDYKYYDAAGNQIITGDAAMGQKIPVYVGKYKSIESIKIRVANSATKKASVGIFNVQLMKDSSAVAEDGISEIFVENNKVTSVVVNNSAETTSKLIVGTYKYEGENLVLTNVRLVDITAEDYENGVATVDNLYMAVPSGSEFIKAYVWFDSDNIQPMFKNLDKEL